MVNEANLNAAADPQADPNPVLAECFRTIEAMGALQAHYGWDMLCKILQEQIDSRFSEIIVKRNSLDEMIPQEYIKGEAHMAVFIKKLPAMMIEHAKETLRRLTPEDSTDDQGQSQSDD